MPLLTFTCIRIRQKSRSKITAAYANMNGQCTIASFFYPETQKQIMHMPVIIPDSDSSNGHNALLCFVMTHWQFRNNRCVSGH